ncbi:hypothetical protein MTR67_032096 [Solanum verrucosum]|uniref:Uncharacterized protein n=1 Tax=Solanum verrucosum TaxID=315347 RepID=A0AAF0U3U0_SOLVR|nr:hypothetical protein MTR67_032096 [Solanum verrucosum]
MSGRTLVLILSLWAVLTIVTPILVRLSASATANGEFFVVITQTSELIKAEKVMGLLARRALVAAPSKKRHFEVEDINYSSLHFRLF